MDLEVVTLLVCKFAGNYGWKEIAWGGTEYIGTKIGKSALEIFTMNHKNLGSFNWSRKPKIL